MLECRVAGPAETQDAFRQVHEQWPHAEDVAEHLQLRLASVQHQRATWFVGCLQGQVVCSLGAYPFHAFGPGGSRPVRIFGAVFTAPWHRRQGYAAQLIRYVTGHYQQEGVADFALFSDIGKRYYEALGFHVLPSFEWNFDVTAVPGPVSFQPDPVPAAALFCRAGGMGCSFGFGSDSEDDAWIGARHAHARFSVWRSGDGRQSYWFLSRQDSEGVYHLLESDMPQTQSGWLAFRQLIAADAGACGCPWARGWWTAPEPLPGASQVEVRPREQEILMWLSTRGVSDVWSSAVNAGGFRAFMSEHV